MPGHDIIVIGTSSGGVDALKHLAAGLPADLPAAVFVVLHRPSDSPSLLADILRSVSRLAVEDAADGDAIVPGRIYVAPPDRHLLIEPKRVRLTRGPKENRFRPAIDPLFRSAANAYGPRVVGVVLTGNLDDGTAGLWAIKDRGGIAVVQDPDEAMFPSMPRSALTNVDVDYCLRLDEIAPTLAAISAKAAGRGAAMSENHEIETRIALEDNALEAGVFKLGKLSPLTCPECHGTLLQIQEGAITRYRCHTGHAYSVNSLLEDVNEAVENSLWNAVRAMDELELLLGHLGEHARERQDEAAVERIARQAADARQRTRLVRQALLRPEAPTEKPASAPGDG